MLNDDPGGDFRSRQEGLQGEGRSGSSDESFGALGLTIALLVVLGVFIALILALVVR